MFIISKEQIVYFAAALLYSIFAISNAAEMDRVAMFRDEISLLEERIKKTEAGRQNTLQQLRDIDRKVDLRRRLIRELQSQATRGARRVGELKSSVGRYQTQIEQLSATLTVDEFNLKQMRQEVGERLAQLYKRMSTEKIALLVTASSLNDLSQRQHYIQAIERYDRLRLDLLRERRNNVLTDRSNKEKLYRDQSLEQARKVNELERVRKLISERRLEERALYEERAEKDRIRQRISADADLLRALLDERRDALREIEDEIKRLENRTAPPSVAWQANIPFDRLAGKLSWPVNRRKVLLSFGRIKHPTLGTSTDNPGIDIEASVGDPVFAVAQGEVTRVAWLRGFGNTIILSHGGGYYTVYSRLGRIMTAEGEVVDPGQTIAEVGESGAGESFHFEIWSKREKRNPIKWLAK